MLLSGYWRDRSILARACPADNLARALDEVQASAGAQAAAGTVQRRLAGRSVGWTTVQHLPQGRGPGGPGHGDVALVPNVCEKGWSYAAGAIVAVRPSAAND